MLAKRIIPCLDVTGGRVVKGVHFVDLVDAGNPVEQAANYDAQGADELTFLDITATSDARAVLLDMIRRVAEQVFIPFTVGGGIRSTEDIREILRAGADKISINTAAVLDRDLISQGSERFGAQCIVVAIDARRVRPEGSPKPDLGYAPDSEIEWRVYTHGGRTVTDIDALEWAREVEQRGAGELLVTSMDADGTTSGYDIELLRRISSSVSIPVIASGGAGHSGHMYDALTLGQADAVLAASIFHFGQTTVGEIKQQLADRDIPVRL